VKDDQAIVEVEMACGGKNGRVLQRLARTNGVSYGKAP
jgi:hypothetical protein